MNAEAQRALADVLARQAEVNMTVTRMLDGAQLTADRFDAELAEMRDGMLALSNRIEALAQAVIQTAKAITTLDELQRLADAVHAADRADDATQADVIHRLPVALTSVETLERERGL